MFRRWPAHSDIFGCSLLHNALFSPLMDLFHLNHSFQFCVFMGFLCEWIFVSLHVSCILPLTLSYLVALSYFSLLDFALFYIYFDTSVFLMRESMDLYERADGRTWEKLGAPWSEYIALKKCVFSMRKTSKRPPVTYFINCCYMNMYIYIYICIPNIPCLVSILSLVCMFWGMTDYLVLGYLLATSSSLERLFLPFSGFFNCL